MKFKIDEGMYSKKEFDLRVRIWRLRREEIAEGMKPKKELSNSQVSELREEWRENTR